MKEYDNLVYEHIMCICHSDEHTVKWVYSKDDSFGEEITFSVFLQSDFGYSLPYWSSDKAPEWLQYIYNDIVAIIYNKATIFLKRSLTAIKYVFGYKSKYGHFDCFSMRVEDADDMIKYLEEFKKAKK